MSNKAKGEFKTPISIKQAIDNIIDRNYLLPAIQRKFVWTSRKIELLFDSLMRGYPINSFMFWHITDKEIKSNYKFYEFLKDYRQKFKEDNPYINTTGYKDFHAVIDGQQRLTSLYIGLKGTYAYKMPRVWWYDTEEAIPTRTLYLNLASKLEDGNEKGAVYDFRFLTKKEFAKLNEDESAIWFKVNDILSFDDDNELRSYIRKQPWSDNDFAWDTLATLHKRIFTEKLINYYEEGAQDIDAVLDIFIRTNSGGEPLSFSNLLMSVTTANWKIHDARKEMDDIVKQVFAIGNPGFTIDADLVLKICLVLYNNNIKFKVKNFNAQSVQIFDDNWERISASIVAAFRLIASWGFNNSNLRAKNAIIPIVYYIYWHNFESVINKPTVLKEEKKFIRLWLCSALLKRLFGAQSDVVLSNIRRVMHANQDKSYFPYEEIKAEFKSDPLRNLSFDAAQIDGLLRTQKDEKDCFSILSLLYSHINFDQELHKDHLHPVSYFKNLKKTEDISEEDYSFYTNPENYNSILNLQLLNGLLNESKNDKPLKDWVEENKIDLEYHLIPKDANLDIREFRSFIIKRRDLLTKKFLEITGSDLSISFSSEADVVAEEEATESQVE